MGRLVGQMAVGCWDGLAQITQNRIGHNEGCTPLKIEARGLKINYLKSPFEITMN